MTGRIKDFLCRYKHGFVMLAYSMIYMLLFGYLEQRPVHGFHVVHTVFDDMIPFCEYFIVPYFLWFPYMIFTVIYFIFKKNGKREYYQLAGNMMMGMTIFLIVSYVYPNMLHLRPAEFPRDNIFTDMVRHLYRIDTPTNVLPSIHVFNSLATHMAITNSESLKNRKGIRIGSLILTLLIIMSTMFLKQHSVIDVFIGATLALFGYLMFYPQQAQETFRQPAMADRRKRRHGKASH